jgi:SnoaL-like domain
MNLFRHSAKHLLVALVAIMVGCATSAEQRAERPAVPRASLKATVISPAEKALAALEIQNIMGRYSAYVLSDRWTEMAELFALDQVDVRQSAPRAMQGPAELKDYFSKRAAEKVPDGVMHQHSFLAPVLEIAGDGQTAKGVWDSPGLDVASGTASANWAWLRYGVDFIHANGQWKIWHLKVVPIWRAPYGADWQEALQAANAAAQPGGKWRYNGKGQVPSEPALPKPYFTFDPTDAY